MKPQEFDVVKLRRPLAGHDLPAGAQGTIVDDRQGGEFPHIYLVEFADADGATQALITIPEDNLEVIWRFKP